MAKTLQDYLGSTASISNGVLTVNLNELYDSIFADQPNSYAPNESNPDELVAVLIAGIHARNKPVLDENGLDITPSSQALVSAESFQDKTFVTRDEVSQIQHEFIFNIYTEDTTGFNPIKAV